MKIPRIYSYPELLFILIVGLLPAPVAAYWMLHSRHGFLVCWFTSMGVGFLVWLAIILLIVWPRFRD